MSTVTLHVGAFKTGTSFIQAVLSSNKERLAADGVLWPGEHWGEQVRGVRGLRMADNADFSDWMSLVDEIDAWEGRSAIISMEFLSLIDAETAKRAVESLSKHRVRIVLTARDLGRAFPAQWQESVQNKQAWTYSEYIQGVIGQNRKLKRAHRHFWNKQDWAKILGVWQDLVPAEDLVLVTVPPSGAPRGLLWERFCESADLEPGRYDATTRVNESLGAASAEVMRYVMLALPSEQRGGSAGRVVKKTLAKQALAEHKSLEPTVILPTEHQEWALTETKQLVERVRQLNPQVIGDLDELTPRFDIPSGPVTTDPSSLSTDELLGAAAHGLAALCLALAEPQPRRRGKRHGPAA